MWSPWSSGSPQKTGSFALSGTSADDGTASDSEVWNGPPIPKRYDATQITIQLSMIVVITSWAPTVPLRKPAIPATNAPASIPPMTDARMSSTRGRSTMSGSSVATRIAASGAGDVLALSSDVEEAAAECERDREPRQYERRPEDERLLEVRGRERRDVVDVPREPDPRVGPRKPDAVAPDLEEPREARAAEDRAVGLERVAEVLRRQEDDDTADQEGQDDGDDRGDDAAPPVDPDSCAVLELGARRRRVDLADRHAAISRFPPPVMATPSSSSVAVGGNSPTNSPS